MTEDLKGEPDAGNERAATGSARHGTVERMKGISLQRATDAAGILLLADLIHAAGWREEAVLVAVIGAWALQLSYSRSVCKSLERFLGKHFS